MVEEGDILSRCLIIYNPESGKKQFVNHLDYVKKRLSDAGYDVSVLATERPKHAISLAKDACIQKYDLLVIAGGDGTLHECINGVAACEYQPTIGYIPSGTACDLASTLKIPKRVEKAVDIILTGVPVKMDVAKSNNGYFIYVAAIGTYVDISYVTDSKLKKKLGYFAYIITGIKEFFTIPIIKTQIVHDKGVQKGHYSLIMVVNSKKVAGFNVINKPILDDGKVDVIVYKYIPLLNNLIYFISFIFAPIMLPGVHKFRTSNLNIYIDDRRKWNTDGEESVSGNLHIEVHKQAIKILVKEKIKHKYFKEVEDGKESN